MRASEQRAGMLWMKGLQMHLNVSAHAWPQPDPEMQECLCLCPGCGALVLLPVHMLGISHIAGMIVSPTTSALYCLLKLLVRSRPEPR